MRRFLAAVAILFSFSACATAHPSPRVPALAGRQVDISADDLAGREVRLAPGRGEVRVIDFFATWCEPCVDQLAHLEDLSRRLGARGVAVWAVSFDQDRAMLDAFVEAHPVSFGVLWDRGGARLAGPLGIQRLPTTVVVDRRGVIRLVRVGYEASERDRLEREVLGLLAEEP